MTTEQRNSRRSLGVQLPAGLLVLVLFAGCAATGMNNMVAVRAQADVPVAATTAAVPPLAPQTYVFAQGRQFPSMFDSEVRKVTFDALTRTLAGDLAPRFTPAAEPAKADLVIVVHWGAIERRENPMDNLAYDPDAVRQASEAVETARTQAAANFQAGNYLAYRQVQAAESDFRNELLRADTFYSADAQSAATSADLIGLRGLQGVGDRTGEVDALGTLLDEDRYFVTLVAYDAAALRLKQKSVRWTARMSVPVAGRDFATAIRQMSAVARPYYGQQRPGMVLQRATR